MSALRRHPHARPEEEADEFGVQLAPLVDIVFLLLVFFLVATTYLDEERDVSVVLPKIETPKGKSQRRLERVLLNVREDGTIILGGRSVDRETLYRALVIARRRNPDVPVVLRGDKAVPHGEVMGVYDVCRRARVRNVAVAVEAPRGGRR